jgi:hypothetical protein
MMESPTPGTPAAMSTVAKGWSSQAQTESVDVMKEVAGKVHDFHR